MRKQSYRRLVGAALSLVCFVVNSALASAPETQFWEQRRQAVKERRSSSSVSLVSLPFAVRVGSSAGFGETIDSSSTLAKIPQEIARTLPVSFFKGTTNLLTTLSLSQGTIRRIKMPRDGAPKKFILHVQDVHLNADAQSRISALVSSVNGCRAVDLVGLEGAFGQIDFSRYRAYPGRATVREVARALLEKGDITGPIHAALSEEADPPAYIGVDDRVHYRANVAAYRAAAPLQSSMVRRVEGDLRQSELIKRRIFSPALHRFDEKITAYQDGRLRLGDHIQNLGKHLPTLSPVLTHFLETWTLEKNIDFNRAEAERRVLVERLVASLDKNSLDSLSVMSKACRAGTMSYADFYQKVRGLTQLAGISISAFPELAGYIHYVLEADRILPDSLFREMRLAEKAAYARLAQTKEEKALVAESRRLHLTKKLVEFGLTPEEWEEIKDHRHPGLAPFEGFYREAQIRDESMTRNFLEAMEKNHAKTALLVTGGFHSVGMEERFLKAGAAVISFSPRIEKIDTAQGSAYLTVFTQEKTPLDRMFQGRTLFLTPPIFPPETSDGRAPLLAAGLAAAQQARQAAENTMTTTFQALSADPGAGRARITTTRLPENQVGVTLRMNGETTTLWVKLSPGKDRILAYDTLRPRERRTAEYAEHLLKKWFDFSADDRWIHAFAGFMEWNFLSRRFVVQHHPNTAAEWVQQIQNRRWLIFGSGMVLVASVLFAVALSGWVFSGPVLNRTLYSFGAAVPLAFVAMGLGHFLMDRFRFSRKEVPAVKRARPPPIEKRLASAVIRLNEDGFAPSVNGQQLSEMTNEPKRLLSHLRQYCVLRSPTAILKVFQDRLSLPPNTSAHGKENEILDLYEGLFDQEAYMNRRFLENPMAVVLARGGRGSASLTQHLSKDARIRVNAIVAGSDAGRSHHVPAHDFDTPGVPDMGKALLDLAQSEPMKDFLGSRFHSENGEDNDSVEEEFMRDFEGLTEFLVNQKTDRRSAHLNAWLEKVAGFPREDSKDDKITLGLFFSSFLRIIKTIHSNRLIGDQSRDKSLRPFRFNNYPLRSIALQGAVWAHLGEGWPDPWQRSMTELAKLLKLRKGDAVRIATSTPQHLMALTADGTIFFGETGLNEYPRTAEIIPLWMVDRFPPLDELLQEFTDSTGLSLEAPTVEELNAQGIDPSVHEELIATVRRLPPHQATPDNIKKMAHFFRNLSRSVRDAQNPVVVHHRTAEVIRDADVILYGTGTQESNIIPIGLPMGIQNAIANNRKAVKIYLVNPTKENKRMPSNAATLLRAFYRSLSGQVEMYSKITWTRAGRYVDYALGHSVEYPGLDGDKAYNAHSPALVGQETKNRVVGVALRLESPVPRARAGVDYTSRPPEFGFFHDSLTKESVIALYAIKTAGWQLTNAGGIIPRKKETPLVHKKDTRILHMNMVRRRMERAGIGKTEQDALLAEMNNFTIKSQQWYYARLMRVLGIPIQQWLPECRNAEWTEMTSRMVELLNSITEVISLDFDDTLEPRNTDLSPLNARRLAQRMAAGQKIVFNTAKTQEELTSVENAITGEKGVEIYAPLRSALVSVLQTERNELSLEMAGNAADDILRDLFFLYMNSGGALARPTVRGITRVVDLPLDPYFTVVYPPELKEKITHILKNEIEGQESDSIPLGYMAGMVLKFYQASVSLLKMIIQPFGPNRKTEKSERAVVADRINTLFQKYNIPAHVNPAGKTSIDVNLRLLGGQSLEKSRAIQHLFNQGHRTVTFIDNEIYEGNAISVRNMVVEMATHPELREGRTLRVIAVDKGLTEEKMSESLGLAMAIVHRFPDFALTHHEVYRPFNVSHILLMNGLVETEATAAFLSNAPFGPKGFRRNLPEGVASFDGVLVLRPSGWTKKLFVLSNTGRRRRFRQKGPWNQQQTLLNQVVDSLKSFRDDVHNLSGTVHSLEVEVAPGFVLPEPAEFTAQLEERMGRQSVNFKFLTRRQPVRQSISAVQPYSVREQRYKAVVHGAFALTGIALVFGHIVLGFGTAWALPVAVLTGVVYFRYAWKAALARNEHRRLMAKASQWDPNKIEINSTESLIALQAQFQRFGFTPIPADPGSFSVTINGHSVKVRLPKDSAEFSSLLSRGRLAETGSQGDVHEIVIAPDIDPRLLPSVVLTEIHRVSPRHSLWVFLRWANARVFKYLGINFKENNELPFLHTERVMNRPYDDDLIPTKTPRTPIFDEHGQAWFFKTFYALALPTRSGRAPDAGSVPLVYSLFYPITRDGRLGGVLLVEIPLLVFLGSASPPLLLSILSLVHVLIERWQNPGRPRWKNILSYSIHFLVAFPYAFIGAPGDAMTFVAWAVYLLYDGILMWLDQARLAGEDMRAFGVSTPADPRRPFVDPFMPPLESLDVNSLDGRAALVAQATRRLITGGSYAQEWAGKVDTLVSFHQVMMEDLPALRAFIANRPGKEHERFQILLVPGANDPVLERALDELTEKNVTVLRHAFEPSGQVKIDGVHFQSWSQGKGSIAWLAARNPRSVPILPDPTLPLLERLIKILESAPPLTRANLDATAAFARALLIAA